MKPEGHLIVRFRVIINPDAPKHASEAAINETIARLLAGRGIVDSDVGYILAEHEDGCPAPDGGLVGCGCAELIFEVWGSNVNAIDPKAAN